MTFTIRNRNFGWSNIYRLFNIIGYIRKFSGNFFISTYSICYFYFVFHFKFFVARQRHPNKLDRLVPECQRRPVVIILNCGKTFRKLLLSLRPASARHSWRSRGQGSPICPARQPSFFVVELGMFPDLRPQRGTLFSCDARLGLFSW